MTQQFTKYMRTHRKFLLDRLSIHTSRKLLTNRSRHDFQRPYLLIGQGRRAFRF